MTHFGGIIADSIEAYHDEVRTKINEILETHGHQAATIVEMWTDQQGLLQTRIIEKSVT